MPMFVTVCLELLKPDVKRRVSPESLVRHASVTLTSATLLARLDSLLYFWEPLLPQWLLTFKIACKLAMFRLELKNP